MARVHLLQKMRFLSLLIFTQLSCLSWAEIQWKPVTTPLASPWVSDIDPQNVLPEYPRPLMQRKEWINLNGLWEFEQAKPSDAIPINRSLQSKILVPFPWESGLSGVRKQFESYRAWYRRLFTLPKNWQQDERILLHFGAVDWEASVFVNGRYIGQHKGGYDAFHFDITDAIIKNKKQEIIVYVYDPGSSEGIAYGKQENRRFKKAQRYTYTPHSGIWQTVWLEKVPQYYLTDYRAIPDIDNQSLSVFVDVNTHRADDLMFEIRAVDNGKVIAKERGSVIGKQPVTIKIPKMKLWWPQNPYLYDLDIVLLDKEGKKQIDKVRGYFGMRKIAIADYYRNNHGPVKRIMLNNKFLFQMGTLDQGYWPAGISTAPTDEALRWDIEETKAWGFNMIRKHIKVEPQRWYYWADKLGVIVWQDMPNSFKKRTEEEKTQFESELLRMVKTHWNHPSIVNWIVFNEHWGAYDVNRLTEYTMALDRSRLVTGNSGIDAGEPDIDYEVGHIKDNHRYHPPDNPFATNTRAVVNGEYGALGYTLEGSLWDEEGPWVNNKHVDKETSTAKYEEFVTSLLKYKKEDELSGAVYTQWTDLESEVNGLYTYDRKIIKLDKSRVTKANLSLWQEDLKGVVKNKKGPYKNNAKSGPKALEVN